MKIVYEGDISNKTVETMKSKHGMEFVNVEDLMRQKSQINKLAKEPEGKLLMVQPGGYYTIPTKKELMIVVKEKGIKNYRILNKDELIKVLDMLKSGATKEQIRDQVINPAIVRWKAGWGTKAVTTVVMILMTCNMAYADLRARGQASFYTRESCHREGTSGITASGQPLNDGALTCALPSHYYIGKRIRVTNTKTGKTVTVTCTDYGPNAHLVYAHNRIIDLSREAFKMIAPLSDGTAGVEIEVLQ
jgi:rare lipoprotein A (peptidoglycan hydrolase)